MFPFIQVLMDITAFLQHHYTFEGHKLLRSCNFWSLEVSPIGILPYIICSTTIIKQNIPGSIVTTDKHSLNLASTAEHWSKPSIYCKNTCLNVFATETNSPLNLVATEKVSSKPRIY